MAPSSAATADTELFGRDEEVAAIARVIESVADRGASLAISGDPGIGKSALLAEATALAGDRGMRVLTTAGFRSEASLPYAGLHQLLRPVEAELERLPGPQRAALMAAFGLTGDESSDVMLTALATLNVLGEVAAEAPLLVVVEDAQWLDRPSLEVLRFVVRRLESDPVVLLSACRVDPDKAPPLADSPELRLAPLEEASARALLAAVAPELPESLRARILDEAAGNPLALRELPVALAADADRDARSLPAWLPLTTRLEQAFAVRVADLPGATHTLLVVAAVNGADRLGETLHATAAVLGEPAADLSILEPAVAKGLVEADGDSLRFRHALVRSAVRQTASLAQRQAAHAALAEVVAAEPDRQVWHRAAASVGPDDAVAAALEAAAASARRRGAAEDALRAFERAAQLSSDPADRGRRLLAAARLAHELGRRKQIRRLLAEAEPLELDPVGRITLVWLREEAAERAWSRSARVGSYVEIAEAFARAGEPELALECLLTIALPLWWLNHGDEAREQVARAAERLDVDELTPALLAVLAYADPLGRGGRVIEALSRIDPAVVGDPLQHYLLGSAASAVWDYAVAHEFLSRAVDGLRDQGRLRLLAQALVSESWAALHLARETLAESAADEGLRFARETGQPRWALAATLAQATLASERGNAERLESLLVEVESRPVTAGPHPMLSLAHFARGRGAIAHQHYEVGIEHLTRALDPTDIAYQPRIGAWGLSDLVEAAALMGDHDRAREFLARLEAVVERTPGSLLRGALAYARAISAGDDTAEDLFRAALVDELVDWPCYRGRLLLAYGRWLRRRRRVTDSRVPLRAARETFDALSFAALAEVARRELRASGETSRHRAFDARDELTPQEMQIAQMAAAGMTNKQIGQKLFLSHRTIGSHLYRIFPKLGISSRAALRDALPAAGDGRADRRTDASPAARSA